MHCHFPSNMPKEIPNTRKSTLHCTQYEEMGKLENKIIKMFSCVRNLLLQEDA